MKNYFNSKIMIGNRKIGINEPVFIVAEAGVAHFGSITRAFKLIDMAVAAGADAIKFQVFKTNKLVSNIAPEWIERLKPKELQYEDFKKIKKYCQKMNILFLSTAHEEESLDYLERLNVPAFKIGSGEVDNLEFIKYIAQKGKPMIISTGLHTLKDIKNVLEACIEEGNRNIIILHCITAYPTPPIEVNLKVINALKNKFNIPVGYSDHTIGFYIPLAAIAAGACVIEKHICLDKNTKGSQDCRVSCDKKDLSIFIKAAREVETSLGSDKKIITPTAGVSLLWARKSIVAKHRLPAGRKLSKEDITFKRPGTGISPSDVNKVLGRTLVKNIDEDNLILWDNLYE